MTRALGVIPARYASTRFPGKVLHPLCGKPLIQWVWERACQAQLLDEVRVATDDERVAQVVTDFGGRACLTRADHPSGTDRVAEVAAATAADIVVNVQGDEPLIAPELIDALVAALAETGGAWDMATAAAPITDDAVLAAPSVVKVVCDQAGAALYFSRSVIPHVREKDGVQPVDGLYWRHIGVYGYRRDFLERLVATAPCALEQAEKLEQLRALYRGARIKVIATTHRALGVDEPSDVAMAEEALRAVGLDESPQ